VAGADSGWSSDDAEDEDGRRIPIMRKHLPRLRQRSALSGAALARPTGGPSSSGVAAPDLAPPTRVMPDEIASYISDGSPAFGSDAENRLGAAQDLHVDWNDVASEPPAEATAEATVQATADTNEQDVLASIAASSDGEGQVVDLARTFSETAGGNVELFVTILQKAARISSEGVEREVAARNAPDLRREVHRIAGSCSYIFASEALEAVQNLKRLLSGMNADALEQQDLGERAEAMVAELVRRVVVMKSALVPVLQTIAPVARDINRRAGAASVPG